MTTNDYKKRLYAVVTPTQVELQPCLLKTSGDADIGRALAQLPQLTGLELGRLKAGDHVSATRAVGGWRVDCSLYLQPGVAAALARSFSGAAAPAGQQKRQPAAEAEAGQTSYFKVSIIIEQEGSSFQQVSELASLGRALAAFNSVDLGLVWGGQACPAAAHALLQPVADQLFALGLWGVSSPGVVLGALQRLVLPRLAQLRLHPGDCTPSAVKAVVGLDAPRLATVTLMGTFAGSRVAVAAAVTALAVGRPQPVGPDGRPAGLAVELNMSQHALSDEELVEVCAAVAAVRGPGCVTLVRR
jgi:hypothetical protein